MGYEKSNLSKGESHEKNSVKNNMSKAVDNQESSTDPLPKTFQIRTR